MADEPSIDEILASLDRLLNEGERRNDDIPEGKRDDGAAAGRPEDSAGAALEAEPVEAPDASSEEAADARLAESAAESVEAPAEGGEDAAARSADAQPKKLLLNEAMLVAPPQEPLPFDRPRDADGPRAAAASAEDGTDRETPTDSDATPAVERPVVPEPDAAWVDALARAVSERIAGALPALVDQIVREELAARFRETPAGTAESDMTSGREDDQDS